MLWYPWACRDRQMALPTMPRCPATKMLESVFMAKCGMSSDFGFLVDQFLARDFQIGGDHDADQFLELHLRLPIELAFHLGGIADEQFDFRRAFIAFVVPDVFFPVQIQQAECLLHELTDSGGFSGG